MHSWTKKKDWKRDVVMGQLSLLETCSKGEPSEMCFIKLGQDKHSFGCVLNILYRNSDEYLFSLSSRDVKVWLILLLEMGNYFFKLNSNSVLKAKCTLQIATLCLKCYIVNKNVL